MPWKSICRFVCPIDERIAPRDVYAVYRAGRSCGIVLTGSAVYVSDKKHSTNLTLGASHVFEINRVNLFTRKLVVDGSHKFVFHGLFWSRFSDFVRAVNEICGSVLLPIDAVRTIDAVRNFHPEEHSPEELRLEQEEVVVNGRS